MNNLDKQYTALLQDILDNHNKYSNEELDLKLKDYYKSIPFDISVFSYKLNKIVKSRFPEGTHWKSYTIKINE
jgi:hypothetical protein